MDRVWNLRRNKEPLSPAWGETKATKRQPDSALPLEAIVKGMCQGTVFYKVRPPDRCYKRKYKIDVQKMRLTYFPSNQPLWRKKMSAACKCTTYSGLGKNVVDLYNLKEVRKGWKTDVFNRLEAKFRRQLQATFHPLLRSMLKEENCFSLVIGTDHAVVDLIAPNVYTRDAWVRGLNQFIASCTSTRKKHAYERWLREQVKKADVNGNGSLNFQECLGLLKQLNISMSEKEARKLFDESNFKKVKIEGEDALEADEFVEFYNKLTHRPELEELMKKYSVSQSTIWDAEELQTFLRLEQKEEFTMEECENFIEKYEPEADRIEGYMTMPGFKAMLLSTEHNIFNKKHRLIYQDMSQPLSHYYIATSHNTYLTGGQLFGESSVEGYIMALTRGCRCVELDIWDGPDGEPIVYHGYTLTSRILFRDVLDAIKQYTFRASQYPVILSLENHCSPSQQVKMAHYLVTILDDLLYKEPVGAEETEYPSPELLARKILVKAKKIRLEHQTSEEYRLEEEEEREEMIATMKAETQDPTPGDENPVLMAAPSFSGICHELSNLVNYCTARRFKSFEECKCLWRFNEMSSFQETVALDLATKEGSPFAEYNKRHLSRIYPKGTRTDSSNYDPIPYWNVGCQLVALNYQTWDKPMNIHEAKFAQNGKCGYLLKPEYLRDSKIPYEPNAEPDKLRRHKVTIKVISGQYLPKPNRSLEGEVVDPYVTVKVLGHPLDEQKKNTNYVNNNGFNPVWNETFEFVLFAPEQALFVFRVRDMCGTAKNKMLGQFLLPFTSMTEGYRHVHLKNDKGESLIPATLFVHVQTEIVLAKSNGTS